MDIKAALLICGLSINFIGSFFLALYIIGEERIRRIENRITQEISIFKVLNTIRANILRKRVIGGPLGEIRLKEEDLGKPLTKQLLKKYIVSPRKVLLYHFVPIMLITLVSIWLIAFYAFHLSPTKAFLISFFLSILSFTQNIYLIFFTFFEVKLGGLIFIINEVLSKSLLYRKTWRKFHEFQMEIELEETGEMDEEGEIMKKIKGCDHLHIYEPKPLPLGQDILVFLILTTWNLFFLSIWFVTALLSIPPYLWSCIVLKIPRFFISKGLKYSKLWNVPFIGLIGISLLILGFFLQLLAHFVS